MRPLSVTIQMKAVEEHFHMKFSGHFSTFSSLKFVEFVQSLRMTLLYSAG